MDAEEAADGSDTEQPVGGLRMVHFGEAEFLGAPESADEAEPMEEAEPVVPVRSPTAAGDEAGGVPDTSSWLGNFT